MNSANETNNIAVSSAEILSIQSYIQSKNIALLTIMFIDIKGFTELTKQQGEQYATRFRIHHDEILTQAIEENSAGLIIKFIGDAVMSVFSEPSVAVERTLKIQQRLDKFNAAQHEFEPINVRIGLHTGQVSISNTLQADVFGPHVNRAARIESLADGGQNLKKCTCPAYSGTSHHQQKKIKYRNSKHSVTRCMITTAIKSRSAWI